ENSPEARQLLVHDWFVKYLGHAPSPADYGRWLPALAGATQERVLSQILGSPEYYARAGGTDAAFVNQLFMDLDQHAAAPQTIFQITVAVLPRVGRADVALLVLTSPEYRSIAITALYVD